MNADERHQHAEELVEEGYRLMADDGDRRRFAVAWVESALMFASNADYWRDRALRRYFVALTLALSVMLVALAVTVAFVAEMA